MSRGRWVSRGTRPGRRRLLFEAVCGLLLLASLESGCKSNGCACSWFAKNEPHVETPSATDVQMLSEGTDPRVTLRVARWAGLRYRMQLEASGTLALEGALPVIAPTTTMVVDSEVLRGSADPLIVRKHGGELRLIEERAVLRSIHVKQDGVAEPLLDAWNQALLPLRGTSYVQHVAESAEVTALTSERLGGSIPAQAAARAVDQTLDQQRHFPFRLPPSPVGVGARWRFHEELSFNGAHGTQIAEMTLKAVDANQALVGIALRQDAPRQTVPHPLVAGASAVLEQFRGDGGGDLLIDRLTAIVLRGRISVTAQSTISADAAGDTNVATLVGASTIQISTTMLSDDDAGGGH